MKKIIQDLVGSKTKSFKGVFDYWQLVTDIGIINIYNPFNCFFSKGYDTKLKEVNRKDLLNTVIVNIDFQTKEYFNFILENNIKLEVSLLDDDYTGPEAISIHYNTGELIVIE